MQINKRFMELLILNKLNSRSTILLSVFLSTAMLASCGGGEPEAPKTPDVAPKTETAQADEQPITQTRTDQSSISDEAFTIPKYLNDANSALLRGSTIGTGEKKNKDVIKRLAVDAVTGDSELKIVDAFLVESIKGYSAVYAIQNNTDHRLCGGHLKKFRLADGSGNPVSSKIVAKFNGPPISRIAALGEKKVDVVTVSCIGPGDAHFAHSFHPLKRELKLEETEEIILPEHVPEKVAGIAGKLSNQDIPNIDVAQFDKQTVKPLSYTVDFNRVSVLMENQGSDLTYWVESSIYVLDENGYPLGVYEGGSVKIKPGEQKETNYRTTEFTGTSHSIRVATQVKKAPDE